MFCFHCQETVRNQACTVREVYRKPEEIADLQDLLIYVCKGIGICGTRLIKIGIDDLHVGHDLYQAFFTTVTNAAWDDHVIISRIKAALVIKE